MARCVHDDRNAEQPDRSPDQVVAVGAEVVHDEAPGEGAGDEDAP
jgi:hypothetical protein